MHIHSLLSRGRIGGISKLKWIFPLLLILVTLSVFGITGRVHAQSGTTGSSSPLAFLNTIPPIYPEPPDRLVVLYVHKTKRCDECKVLQSYAQDAVDTLYAIDQRLGRIYFKELNYEALESQDLIKDYNITYSGIILLRYGNNTRVEWKKLEDMQGYGQNKPGIWRFLRKEIGDMIVKVY